MKQTEYNKAKKRMIISLVFLAFGVIYALSPIDIIPDILIPIGWIDDLAVLLAAAVSSVLSFLRLHLAKKKMQSVYPVKQ